MSHSDNFAAFKAAQAGKSEPMKQLLALVVEMVRRKGAVQINRSASGAEKVRDVDAHLLERTGQLALRRHHHFPHPLQCLRVCGNVDAVFAAAFFNEPIDQVIVKVVAPQEPITRYPPPLDIRPALYRGW